MNKMLLVLLCVFALGAAPVTQPAPVSQPVATSAPRDASPTVMSVNPAELVKDAKDALAAGAEAIKKTKEYAAGKEEATNSTERALALFGIITLVLKFLLSLLKIAIPFFKGPKAGLILRISTVGVGVLVFLFSNMALGIPWVDSLIMALGGPGALFFHEITKIFPWFQTKDEPKGNEQPKTEVPK